VRGPAADVAQPDPSPENTPAVLVPLASAPNTAPPMGAWKRLLGPYGTTELGALRQDRDGFTLVGGHLADLWDLGDLDEKLDAVVLPEAPAEFVAHRPSPPKYRLVTYRLADRGARAPAAFAMGETWAGAEFRPGMLDGERLRWKVVRCRRLAAE